MRHFALLLVSLGLSVAAVAAEPQAGTASRPDNLNAIAALPCQPTGDGTFTEIVTTMASVLPRAEGDALLAKHCGECFKRKFLLGQLPGAKHN